MNLKETYRNKKAGFYVGVGGAVCALVALIIYIAMGSMYFSGWVVAGLVVGIVVFAVSTMFKFNIGIIISYVCYLFAMYFFFRYEIDFRMDILVDASQGFAALDGAFLAASVFFIVGIIATIVSSCMKQDRPAEAQQT